MATYFTDEQINEILNIFRQNMGHRQYIGARYVPIFGRVGETSIEWDNTAPYEPLTIVLHQGNSFTSRQYVPAGIDINDTRYWANTGNFNAQVEQYRQEVLSVSETVDSLDSTIKDLSGTVLPHDTFTKGLQFAIARYAAQKSRCQGITENEGKFYISVTLENETLGTDDASVLTIDAETGTVLNEYEVSESRHLGDITFHDGYIYGSTYPDKRIIKFNASNGALNENITPIVNTVTGDYVVGIEYYNGRFYGRTDSNYIVVSDDECRTFNSLFENPFFTTDYVDQGITILDDFIYCVIAAPNAIVKTPINELNVTISEPNSNYFGKETIGEFEGITKANGELVILASAYSQGVFPQFIKVFSNEKPAINVINTSFNNTEYVNRSINYTLQNINPTSNTPFNRVINLNGQEWTEDIQIRGNVFLRNGTITGNIELTRGAELTIESTTVNGNVNGEEGNLNIYYNCVITGNVRVNRLYIKRDTTISGTVIAAEVSCSNNPTMQALKYNFFPTSVKFMRSPFYYTFDTAAQMVEIPENLRIFFANGCCGEIIVSIFEDSASATVPVQITMRSGAASVRATTPLGAVTLRYNNGNLTTDNGFIKRLDFIA